MLKELCGIVAGYCIIETIVPDTRDFKRVVERGGFFAVSAVRGFTEDWCSIFATETLSMRSSFAIVIRWPHLCAPLQRRCYVGVARREGVVGDDVPSYQMWAIHSSPHLNNRKFHGTWSGGETYTPIQQLIFVDLPTCTCPRPSERIWSAEYAPLPGSGISAETEWRVEIHADLVTGSLRFIVDGADQGILWTNIPALGELRAFASISEWGSPAVAFTPVLGLAE